MSEEPKTAWADLDDTQLGARIAALNPAVEPTDVDLVSAVRSAVETNPLSRQDDRRPTRLALAAAIILLVGVLVLSIAPARSAVAGWLGIGSTSVLIVDPLPTASSAAPPANMGGDEETIRRAAQQIDLVVQLPDPELVGAPSGWEIRGDPSAGELFVIWEHFALTARASSPATPGRKSVLSIDDVSTVVLVNATPALWIEGPHTREAGEVIELVDNTLIWETNGLEYRISGELDKNESIEIASTLR